MIIFDQLINYSLISMRLPTRKGELHRMMNRKDDKYITQDAFDRMESKLERLKSSLITLAQEVTRTQEMGDLSENAAYQEAKFTLRRTMGQIEGLKQRIKEAIIIEKPIQSDVVQIGSTVTIVVDGKQRVFEILGSHESDPLKGKISHLSPIGSALLNHRVGDKVGIEIQGVQIEHQIIEIS